VGDQATQRNAAELELTARLAGSVQRVRMFGTAATDLAWLAAGHIDAAIALSNEPWDMTAGTIIAREAGAHITDANGTNHTHSSTETIASNTHLHAQILNLTTP
jgi:myo-inositol-1(or 4)-monophosphatase